MAITRNKIKGIGLPFNPQYSSCSNIKPKEFDWSIEQGDINVVVDYGIITRPDLTCPRNKRFGWICESRFIIPHVYEFLKENHNVLLETFYNKIFTCDHTLLELNKNFVYCPSGSNYPWVKKQDWKLYEKNKICSMFCSPKLLTQNHHYRHNIAKLVIDAGFDVFGGAHGTMRTVLDPQNPWDTKIHGLQDYMFSIVVENGVYDSYYTEKLTDCFATGTIPVYCGSNKLPSIFDENGIIRLYPGKEKDTIQNLNKDVYISKLESVKNNLEALNVLETADDYLYNCINQ